MFIFFNRKGILVIHKCLWTRIPPPILYEQCVVRRHCRCRWCCRKLFTFSHSSTEPLDKFQPNLAQSTSWVKGIKVYSNEGPRRFPRGDNDEIAKIQ